MCPDYRGDGRSLYNVLKFIKLYTLRNTHFSLVIYKVVFFFFQKETQNRTPPKKRILVFNFILKCWFKSRNQRQVVTTNFSHPITESCLQSQDALGSLRAELSDRLSIFGWPDSYKWTICSPGWPEIFFCQLFNLVVHTAKFPRELPIHHISKDFVNWLLAMIQFVPTSLLAFFLPSEIYAFLGLLNQIYFLKLKTSILCLFHIMPISLTFISFLRPPHRSFFWGWINTWRWMDIWYWTRPRENWSMFSAQLLPPSLQHKYSEKPTCGQCGSTTLSLTPSSESRQLGSCGPPWAAHFVSTIAFS